MSENNTTDDQVIQSAHLIYALHKPAPNQQQKNRSRSLFPTLKDGHGLQIVRFEQESPSSTPNQQPSVSSQFVVTTIRAHHENEQNDKGNITISRILQRSALVSTVDSKRSTNIAFDQHFRKQTHFNHEKSKNNRLVKSQVNSHRDDAQQDGSISMTVQANIKSEDRNTPAPAGSLLDLKVIETWINDMLVEAEFTQSEFKTKNSALKKFGVDRKTLRTKGLAQQDVDRVFRCLFVYSFGFYEMLMDILSHSTDAHKLMASIWKVFGVLLEYCSRGDFRSTVNQLEKEKRAEVDSMIQLLSVKEKQLQAIEIRERDRHSKLLEDVTHLSQQRDMLLIEKTQIEEDFKQADLAFNDEVALRLKFEYRINEIHGIHRELLAKHNKLLDDIIISKKQLERFEKELQTAKRQVEVLIIEKRGLEAEINNQRIQLDNTQMALIGKDTQIQELGIRLSAFRKQENQDFVDRKVSENNQQTSSLRAFNLEGAIMTSKQRENELIAQCSELEAVKSLQTKRISDLDSEAQDYQRQYHESNTKFQNILRLERKLREQLDTLRIEKLDSDHLREQISIEKQQSEIDLQFMVQKCDIQERELAMLNQNIQQMKTIKIQLDEEYIKQHMKVEQLLEGVSSKEDMIIELEKCLSYSQQRLHSVISELTEIENNSRMKEDDFRVQVTSIQKKNDFLDVCLMTERADLHAERERMAIVEGEINTTRQEMADLKAQNKNDVFEKNTLQTKSTFMTRVIDNERLRNSELLNDLTLTKISFENVEREHKALKVINQEQVEIAKLEIQQLRTRIQRNLDEQRLQNKEMIYKIYYEDALSALLRETLTSKADKQRITLLYSMIEDREASMKKDQSNYQILMHQLEIFKFSNNELIQKQKENTQKLKLLQLVSKKIQMYSSQTEQQLQDSVSKLEIQKISIQNYISKYEDVQLEVEKQKILIKRLKKEKLIKLEGSQRDSSKSRLQITNESEKKISLAIHTTQQLREQEPSIKKISEQINKTSQDFTVEFSNSDNISHPPDNYVKVLLNNEENQMNFDTQRQQVNFVPPQSRQTFDSNPNQISNRNRGRQQNKLTRLDFQDDENTTRTRANSLGQPKKQSQQRQRNNQSKDIKQNTIINELTGEDVIQSIESHQDYLSQSDQPQKQNNQIIQFQANEVEVSQYSSNTNKSQMNQLNIQVLNQNQDQSLQKQQKLFKDQLNQNYLDYDVDIEVINKQSKKNVTIIENKLSDQQCYNNQKTKRQYQSEQKNNTNEQQRIVSLKSKSRGQQFNNSQEPALQEQNARSQSNQENTQDNYKNKIQKQMFQLIFRTDMREFGRLYQIASNHYQL